MAHGDAQPTGDARFDVVLRGYDRRQVEDHLTDLEARLAAAGRECATLRMQRDAEASRARDLESRLSGPQSAPAAAAAGAAPGGGLEGFGMHVESILRVATQEAESIRRAAVESGRQHAEAEVRLRSTFEGIAERLQPLVSRLDEEAGTARAALAGAGDDAGELETAARAQAQTMIDAATATAARMRADAERRQDITARQAADAREELALVRQILSTLSPPPGSTTTVSAATDSTAPGASADVHDASTGEIPTTPADGADAESTANRAEASPGQRGNGNSPADPPSDATGPVHRPSTSGPRLDKPSTPSPMQQTMPVGQGQRPSAGPVVLDKPESATGPGAGGAQDAPTETIALPVDELRRATPGGQT